MNTYKIAILCILVLLALVSVLPASSHPTDAIVVTNADSVLDTSVAGSQDLANSLSNIGSRFVVQYANTIGYYDLAPSSSLINSTANVGTHFIMQYANSNQTFALLYPIALLGDSTPPQVTVVTATLSGANNIIIYWATDEFASSIFSYGMQSGMYTSTITDTLYFRDHSVSLTGLASGKYYFMIRSTDQSGNTSLSQEYNFTTKTFVYLPVVLKNR